MNVNESEKQENGRDQSEITIRIDDQPYRVHKTRLTGRQLLEAASKQPAEEYLIYLLDQERVMEDIGPEESVDVGKSGTSDFLTFKSDRSFRFELNGHREDWGAAKISEATLRKIAAVNDEYGVWFEQGNGPGRELAAGEMVDLTGEGIERFHTDQRLRVTVINENNGVEVALVAHRKTRVQTLIERIYEKLGVTRQADDRLRCQGNGEDVFSFASLTLGEYLDAGHCNKLVWVYAGGTGGASCL